MTRECERCRERALRDGLNSRAGDLWRRHSRNCPECRAEIYLLGMLGETGSDCRQHIPRQDYDRLLREVRENSARRRARIRAAARPPGLAAVLRIAAAAVCILGAVSGSLGGYRLWLRNPGAPVALASAAGPAEPHFSEDESFSVGETAGVFAPAAAPAAQALPGGALPVWDSDLERSLAELRNDLEDERLFYTGMIDRELQE